MKPGSRKINALFFLGYCRHGAEILRFKEPAGGIPAGYLTMTKKNGRGLPEHTFVRTDIKADNVVRPGGQLCRIIALYRVLFT